MPRSTSTAPATCAASATSAEWEAGNRLAVPAFSSDEEHNNQVRLRTLTRGDEAHSRLQMLEPVMQPADHTFKRGESHIVARLTTTNLLGLLGHG